MFCSVLITRKSFECLFNFVLLLSFALTFVVLGVEIQVCFFFNFNEFNIQFGSFHIISSTFNVNSELCKTHNNM